MISALSVILKDCLKAQRLALRNDFSEHLPLVKTGAGQYEAFSECVKAALFLLTPTAEPQLTYWAVVGGFRGRALFMCLGFGDFGGFR